MKSIENACNNDASSSRCNIPDKIHVEDIKIEIPSGKIAGKWWGPRDVRPIIALHGFQDNAGTFDALIPLLPRHISFLALDMPGHGLSSRLSNGQFYHSRDMLPILIFIMKKFNWDKISLMGHSRGAAIAFLFTAVFPEKVDLYIGLDGILALNPEPEKFAGFYKSLVEMFVESVSDILAHPPSYSYEECIDKQHRGFGGSVDRKACPYLLERGLQKSTLSSNKYYFSRDRRLKSDRLMEFNFDIIKELAKSVKVPYLFFKFSKYQFNIKEESYEELMTIFKENPNFYIENVEGTHHTHLNEPEKIYVKMTEFLNRHWKMVANKISSKL